MHLCRGEVGFSIHISKLFYMLINVPLSSFAIQAYTHIKAIIKALRQARAALS